MSNGQYGKIGLYLMCVTLPDTTLTLFIQLDQSPHTMLRDISREVIPRIGYDTLVQKSAITDQKTFTELMFTDLVNDFLHSNQKTLADVFSEFLEDPEKVVDALRAWGFNLKE